MKLGSMLLVASVAVLLSACLGSPTKPADVAQFDLGPMPSPLPSLPIALRSVEVLAPSWLGTSSMAYRLNYATSERRQVFAESRWVAPPAELLEVNLRRQLVSTATASCRLRLELDEFVQVFDSPTDSRSVIEARVSLLSGKGDHVLARHAINLGKATSRADAKGGVSAFSGLAVEAGKNVAEWMTKLNTQQAALVASCRQ